MSIEKLDKFRPWIQKVMPAVYDDSLTYYEALSKVITYMNQVNDQCNEIVDYLDAKFDGEDSSIAQLRSDFVTYQTSVNNSYDSFQTKINADFASYETAFDQFKNDITAITLPANVETILNSWYDSGKLATIINNDVFNMKANTVDLNATNALLSQLAVQVKSNGNDDTQNIQNAIDQIEAKGGGILYLPDLTYIIKDTTTYKGLKPCPNLIIRGGINTTLKLGSSRCNIISNHSVDFLINGYGTLHDVIIENITFDGDYHNISDPATGNLDGDNYGFGVYIVKAKNITIRNCKFYRHWYGGYNLFGVDGQKVEGNYFEDISLLPNAEGVPYSAMGGDGSFDSPSKNVIVKNNRIYNCGSGYRANGGVNNGAVSDSPSWFIEDNTFDTVNSGIDLYMGQYTDVYIQSNVIKNVQYRAIAISGGGESVLRSTALKRITISNNKIISTTQSATGTSLIYAYSTDLLNVIDNDIIVSVNMDSNDVIVINGEYNGSGIVYPYAIVRGNKITSLNVRYVFNMQGKIILTDNVVNSATVTKAVFGTSNTDLTANDNVFTITGGIVWARDAAPRVWLRNRGYKTSNYGQGGYVDGATVPHEIGSGTPPIIHVTVKGDLPYFATATADDTNITFHIYNFDGTKVVGSVPLMWSCYHWDFFEYL